MMGEGLEPFDLDVLDDAGAAQDLGVAYGIARRHFGDVSPDELQKAVRKSLLKLVDRGLIALFRAPRDAGYSHQLEEVALMTRDEIVRELDLGPNFVSDEADLVFFVETSDGRDLFASLPPQ